VLEETSEVGTMITTHRQLDSPEFVPEIGLCRETHKLLANYSAAVRELVALEQRQGDPNLPPFDLLYCAIQKMNAAKDALLGHIERHQC
jgi:hypothetical protein